MFFFFKLRAGPGDWDIKIHKRWDDFLPPLSYELETCFPRACVEAIIVSANWERGIEAGSLTFEDGF